MPATPDELFAYLDSLGIPHQTVTHAPVFTVGEARELRGAVAGGHTKNLFLRDKKGAAYLVVAPEDAAVELRSLHRALGARDVEMKQDFKKDRLLIRVHRAPGMERTVVEVNNTDPSSAAAWV